MIDCILNFFIEHWMIIIPCFLGFIEFVLLLIFKKRPEVLANDLTESIICQVNTAEKIYGHGNGKEKLDYVLNYFKNKLGSNYFYFEKYIIAAIDSILDCQSK